MKTRTAKALLLALCAVLLVVSTVFATLAYLTSTDKVENTFTVGNVKITLDEVKVTPDGTAEGTDRVKENTYKLMPGHSYTKDPTIHVDAASEDCWLFVKVENGLADILDATTIADQLEANGWTLVSETENVYARAATNKAGEDVKVFENFKIKGDVANDTLATYAGKKIVVTAYAIQADGFTTAEAAWTAAGLN